MTDAVKVSYRTRSGYESVAYIDMATGEGTDKHSDIPVKLKWMDDASAWIQVDDWVWEWDKDTGEFRKAETARPIAHRMTRGELSDLPVGTMVRVTWDNGYELPVIAVRVPSPGATSGQYMMLSERSWLSMAGWIGTTMEVLYDPRKSGVKNDTP